MKQENETTDIDTNTDNAATSAKPNPSHSSPSWRRAMPVWVQGLVLLVVFAAGLGVGVVGTSEHILGRMQHYRDSPEAFPAEITASLTRQLDLSDEQAVKVQQHIAFRHGRITKIREKSAPEILKEFSLMKQEVANELTPEQTTKWNETSEWAQKTFLPVAPKVTPKNRD